MEISELTKIDPKDLDRRIHAWVAPLGSYAPREEILKCDLKYCICLQHYITPKERERNKCAKLCG